MEYRIINTEDLPNEVTQNTVQAHKLGIKKTLKGKYIIKNLISTDLPGRYIFLLYDHDTNYIHACPIKSRKAEDLIIGFSTCYAELKRNGFTATNLKLDNEISKLFETYIDEVEKITYQKVAAGNH